MTPEWSRPERLDAIGEGERVIAIEADAAERQALARRFDIRRIERLAARLAVRRDGSGIRVTGRVEAVVEQECSVTGEPLTSTIDEPVALLFVEPATGEDEHELTADAIDTVDLEGNAIDLGEVAAETVALAIDPFPRAPAAADVLRRAGVVPEEEAGPFGALGGLKEMMERRR